MLIFYKVFKAEKFGYSFLFSNIIDSTYVKQNKKGDNKKSEIILLFTLEKFLSQPINV